MEQFCIARRACADRNSFKLYREEGGAIKEAFYIWTEYRCPNQAGSAKNPDYCSECAVKIPGFKYVANPKCDHGYVGGPYPKESKLYGSPYYLLKSKEGWKIREQDEKRAKECQEKANSMAPKKKTTVPASTSETPAVVEVAPEVKPKQPKQPRKLKVAKKAEAVEATIAAVPVSGPPSFVESTAAPLILTEVIRVKVKKIKIAGTEYFLDSKTNKVYGTSKGGVGPYKGRYDEANGAILSEYPDSDIE
jgi:hypothetical protein